MTTPVISNHAIVRFLERALGIDLRLWRESIAAAGLYGDGELIRAIEHNRSLDDCRAAIADSVRSGIQKGAVSVYYGGLTFCLRGPCVLTVVPGRAHPKLLRRSDGSRLARGRVAA